jgi:hypothetical protein
MYDEMITVSCKKIITSFFYHTRRPSMNNNRKIKAMFFFEVAAHWRDKIHELEKMLFFYRHSIKRQTR